MRSLKGFLIISITLLLVSCSMSAKTEGKPAEKAVASGEVIHLTKTEFLSKVFNFEKSPNKWVYEGNKPCIIDFYADWCGPCKKVAPILNELAETYKNEIIIYKVNVDKEKELATAFGIQSIPTFLFIPLNGQPQVAQGALPKEAFIEQINSFLLGKK